MQNVKPALLPEAESHRWFAQQADYALEAKQMPPERRSSLADSLSQAYQNIYRAVAFDVDGTLTPPGDIHVSKRMAEIVAGLLLRGVPLLFISGRGRRSVRAAVDDILRLANLHPSYLRLLRCVTHNGLFYLSTPNEFPARPLSQERCIAEPLANVEKLQSELSIQFREQGLVSHISTEPTGPDVYAIRVVTAAGANISQVRAIIDEAALASELTDYHVCVGAYGQEISVDVSTTNKGIALLEFSRDIGTNIHQILCIGDRGDEQGNDFDLLRGNNGFSVGTLSSEEDGCHPIISDSGEVQQGEQATRLLLSRVLLFPAISITADPIEKRLESLRVFERVALQRAREETVLTLSKVRNRLRYLLDPRSREGILPTLSLDDLMDERSGGIRLRDYEIPDIGEYPQVAELFGLQALGKSHKEPPRGSWWMYTESSVLLRGPSYYFGMSQADARLCAYLPLCLKFLRDADAVLRLYKAHRVTLASFKVLLAILDNVRNFLILALFACFEGETETGDLGFCTTRDLHGLLVSHSDYFIQFLIGPAAPWSELVESLASHLAAVSGALVKLESDPSELSCGIRERTLRNWRECDNFLENYTAVQLALSEFAEQYERRPQYMCVMGLLYGGIELPAIAKAIGSHQGWLLTAGLCKVSIYHDRLAGAALRAGDYEALRKKLAESEQIFFDDPNYQAAGRPLVLADDNTTTGVTLQLARDYFVAKGADVRGSLIVRFPGANRHVQMAIPGHGFPNPEMFFSFIRGLVSPSPYSRLLFPNEGDSDPYLDNLGVFCKSRERIVRYLIKNGTPPLMKGKARVEKSARRGGA